MDERDGAWIYGSHIRRVARSEDSLEDFIFDTVTAALRAWSLTVSDLDCITMASSDQLDGRSISAMVTGGSVGAYRRDLINLSTASEHAAYHLAARIAAGRCRLGLVASWGKPSEAPLPVVDRLTLDPFFARAAPHERGAALDLEVSALRRRPGLSEDGASAVREKNVRNAAANPRAVLAAHAERMAPPHADACVALLMGDGHAAGRPRVRIAGMSAATDSAWNARVDPQRMLAAAATRAYQRAGLSDPAGEVAFAEIADLSPWHELTAYEALGFTTPGSASSFALSGATRHDGSLPVNRSGGLAAGDADFALGLVSLAEAALQLFASAGMSRAVVQASPRTTSQLQTVFVLESHS